MSFDKPRAETLPQRSGHFSRRDSHARLGLISLHNLLILASGVFTPRTAGIAIQTIGSSFVLLTISLGISGV